MDNIDKFYPLSETLERGGFGATFSLQVKLINHLASAQAGDRDAESRLVNRVGQVRRQYVHFQDVPAALQGIIKESVTWLRSTGRQVNLAHPDPAMWITTRSGDPRW